MNWLKRIYYSFPIQLLLISLKRHQLLLAFWGLLFFIVVGKFAISYGVPYLFFDPEYLDHNGYLSFALVGMGFGTFLVAWNLNCYMLHSYRFPFMARFNKPMGVYFLNNSLIPVLFLVCYFTAVIRFQTESQYASRWQIAIDLMGFSVGVIFVLLTTAVYFTVTNRSALLIEENYHLNKHKKSIWRWLRYDTEASRIQVDYYLAHNLKWHRTKEIKDHNYEATKLIYRWHHWNAFLVQSIVIGLVLAIGVWMNHSLFQIPAAASAFMLLSILISVFGLLIYWTGGWGTTAIIVFFVTVNQLYKIDMLGYQSRVYGLTYQTKARYNEDEFKALSSPKNIQHDISQFYTILENWRIKNSKGKLPGYKPKMIFINVSGGGLRAAMFAAAVMQHADSVLGGKLLDQTFMISGASGGMFGAAYMRELFLQKKQGAIINLWDQAYSYRIARDLLNPVMVSLISNDMFLPIHLFTQDSITYYKDRGYMLEQKLLLNTDGLLRKNISDYYQDELLARIPLLMIHTEVMNDTRRFFVSAQPCSFFMRPVGRYTTNRNLEIDAIDFCRFFKHQRGDKVTLLSSLRMNATFPLILPNSTLPTEPKTYILDGGALDNVGYEPTFRLLSTFRDWINENTSGVEIIQVRDGVKNEGESMAIEREDLFTMLTNPLGTIFSNHMSNENFAIDQKLGYANEALQGKVQMISFEYMAESESMKAALSLHLTQREKESILHAVTRTNNNEAFRLLVEGMK